MDHYAAYLVFCACAPALVPFVVSRGRAISVEGRALEETLLIFGGWPVSGELPMLGGCLPLGDGLPPGDFQFPAAVGV